MTIKDLNLDVEMKYLRPMHRIASSLIIILFVTEYIFISKFCSP